MLQRREAKRRQRAQWQHRRQDFEEMAECTFAPAIFTKPEKRAQAVQRSERLEQVRNHLENLSDHSYDRVPPPRPATRCGFSPPRRRNPGSGDHAPPDNPAPQHELSPPQPHQEMAEYTFAQAVQRCPEKRAQATAPGGGEATSFLQQARAAGVDPAQLEGTWTCAPPGQQACTVIHPPPPPAQEPRGTLSDRASDRTATPPGFARQVVVAPSAAPAPGLASTVATLPPDGRNSPPCRTRSPLITMAPASWVPPPLSPGSPTRAADSPVGRRVPVVQPGSSRPVSAGVHTRPSPSSPHQSARAHVLAAGVGGCASWSPTPTTSATASPLAASRLISAVATVTAPPPAADSRALVDRTNFSGPQGAHGSQQLGSCPGKPPRPPAPCAGACTVGTPHLPAPTGLGNLSVLRSPSVPPSGGARPAATASPVPPAGACSNFPKPGSGGAVAPCFAAKTIAQPANLSASTAGPMLRPGPGRAF